MPNITLYTKQTCPYCNAAKQLLKQKGATYHEIDIESDPKLREEMIERSGRLTVPQIFIGERHIGGYDDLKALDDERGLDPLLK